MLVHYENIAALLMLYNIEIFGNHSDEKCVRNFPLIMPYFGHIVEQPIEIFYCSLLISSKVRIRMIYVIDSFV